MAFPNAGGGVILAGVTDRGYVKGANLSVASEMALRRALDQVRDLAPYRVCRVVVDAPVVVTISVGSRKDFSCAVVQRSGGAASGSVEPHAAGRRSRRFHREAVRSSVSLRMPDGPWI